MTCWSADPVLFTKRDYEGHRLRLTIAEKRAKCATRILDRANPPPDYLADINPDGAYPILVDKNLVCYGAPLDELLHERYPGPPLLPQDPIRRAQVRMLADRVRSWYALSATALTNELKEAAAIYTGAWPFFAGESISVIDIALAPIMYEVPQQFIAEASAAFLDYRYRLLSRQAFRDSLKPQLPVNDMTAGSDDDIELEESVA